MHAFFKLPKLFFGACLMLWLVLMNPIAHAQDNNIDPFNDIAAGLGADDWSYQIEGQLNSLNMLVDTFGFSNSLDLIQTGAGPFGDIIGSMYHKDAHNRPGGLYGPGGQFEESFALFEIMVGGDGMAWLANAVSGAGELYTTPSAPPILTHDEMCFLIKTAIIATSTAVGGFIGTVAGGTAGSAVPVAGTGAGAVVGGLAGGAVGTFGGALLWIQVNDSIGCPT